MLSVQEFSAKVKSKYPEYKDVDDATLAQKIVNKYPEYKGKVDLDGTLTPTKSTQPTPQANGDYFGKGIVDFVGNTAKGAVQGAVESIPGVGQIAQSARMMGQADQINKGEKAGVGQIGDVAGEMASGAVEYGAKPLVKGGLMASAGPLIAGSKQAFTGKGIEDEINVPGIGNINPNTSVENTLGTAADFAGAAVNLSTAGSASPLLTAGRVAAGSALQGGGKAAQEGKTDEIVSRGLTEGAIGGLTAGVLSKVMGKFNPKTQKEIDTKLQENLKKGALKSGLKENYVNALTGLDDGQKQIALEYLDQGMRKIKDPINETGVYDKAGEEINLFYEQAKEGVDELGKQLGKLKSTLDGKMADTAPLTQKLAEFQKNYNIKINSKGKLTNVGDVGSKTSIFQKFIDFSQNPNVNWFTGKKVNARDLESLTSEIDALIGTYTTKGINTSNPKVRILTEMKEALNQAIGETVPEFAAANKAFATAKTNLGTMESVGRLNAGKEELFNGGTMLRRSLGNAADKPNEAIEAIGRLAENLGIEPPTDLKTKAFLADLVERYTGSAQPQSLAGGVEKASEIATNEAKKRIPGLTTGIELVESLKAPELKLTKQAQQLKDLIQNSILPKALKRTPKTTPVLTPKVKAQVTNAVNLLVRVGAQGLFSNQTD